MKSIGLNEQQFEKMKSLVQEAKEAPLPDRTVIMVAVKEADGWRVAAGQFAKQHEGP